MADTDWGRSPSTHPHDYGTRARQVYWDLSFPACRAKGPEKARCVLDRGHSGDHYGNGFDEWGPRGRIWWAKARSGARSHRG